MMNLILPKSKILTVFLFFILAQTIAFGATITSTGTGGLWNVGASWVGGIVPASTDDVVIVSGATITVDGNPSAKTLDIRGILLFNANNTSVSLPTNGTIKIVSPNGSVNNSGSCSNTRQIIIGGTLYAACTGGGQGVKDFNDLNTAGGTCLTNAGTLSGNQYLCSYNATVTNFVSTETGGTWSSSNTSIATVNSTTGAVTSVVNANGTANITYTVARTGCTTQTATRTVYVANNQPATPSSLTGSFSQCQNSTTIYTVNSIPNVTYNWVYTASGGTVTPASNGLTASVYYNSTAATNGRIEVSTTNGCGTSGPLGSNVVVSATSSGGSTTVNGTTSTTISGCANTYIANIGLSGYVGTPLRWELSLDNFATISSTVVGNSNNINAANLTQTTYFRAVVQNSPCSIAYSTICAVIISTTPPTGSVGTITGTPTVCQGQSGVAYTVAAVAGATGYNWNLPSGASIATGANTNSITVNYNTSAISGNITVQATNGCGTGSTSPNYAVTVNSLANNTTSTASICESSTKALVGSPSGGTWSIFSGSGSISSSTYTPADVAVNTPVTVRYSVAANGSCPASTSDAVFTVNATPTTATVGTAQNRCGTLTTAALGGNTPSVGTGTWIQFSGPGTSTFSSVNSGSSTATASIVGTYVYRWTISNGSCTSSTANITVNYYGAPTTATVGTAQNRCGTLTTAALGGNTPSVGTGTWTQFSGPGTSTFSSVNSGTSTATASVVGTYVYRWTISNGSCTSSTADVTVNYYATPTTATVGSAQNRCATLTTAALGGNAPSVGTGTWTQFSGPGTSSFSAVNSGSSTATASVVGTYVYRWTISNGSCTSIADVTVNYFAAPTTATVGSAQNRCGSLTTAALGGNAPSVGTGTWTQFSGPGTSTFSAVNAGTSTATASIVGTYVYRWTISNGSCTSSTADVTVNYYASPTTATVGSAQDRCATLTTAALGGNTPSVGIGTWTQFSGPGTSSFSAVNSGSSTATASVLGTYVYRWTISNGSCTSSFADVTVNYYATPTAGAGGVLSAICQGNTSSAMGGSVGGGATGGIWTGGAGTWTNANNPSTATYTSGASESGSIILTLTTSGGSCGTTNVTKSIIVNPSPTLATATQTIFACDGTGAGSASPVTIKLTGLLSGSTSTINYTIDTVPQTITGVIADAAGEASFDTRILTPTDNGETLQITGITTTSASPSCSNSFSINVILNVKPDSGGISLNGGTAIASGGNTTFSELTTATFSIATVPGATGYTWVVPASWTNLSGQGTTSITVTTGTESPSSSNSVLVFATNMFCPSSLGVTLTSIAPTAPTPNLVIPVTCSALGSISFDNLPTGDWTLDVVKDGVPFTSISNPAGGAAWTVGSLPAGTYTFTVTNDYGSASATVVLNRVTKTWNGSGWFLDSNPTIPPTSDEYVEFAAGIYNSPTSIDACSCTVKNGATVIISSVLNIVNGLTVEAGGTLIFENNASLVQLNDAAVNQGVITYKRTTPGLKDLDYEYWSSPVSSQKLSDLWASDRYFRYTNGAWEAQIGNTTMDLGRGYIIRVRTSSPPFYQSVEFKGVPNNGIKSITAQGANKSNLIGNPYPSAIDAETFMISNSIVGGALYFWTHFTARKLVGSTFIYEADDYAVFNLTGGGSTAPSTNGTGVTPLGEIAAGQAFFVVSDQDGDFTFDNSMRFDIDNGNVLDNNQFFRPSNTKKAAKIERNRVWLNLTNEGGAFKQLLVGYVTGASNDFDKLYDGVTRNGNAFVDFYSVNNSKNYTIQGRGLPFDKTDEVPLGYKTTIAGTFKIGIDKVDGGMTNQTIYLEDKLTNTIHDLKSGSYSFATEIGAFNDRFILRYTNTSKLGTGDAEVKGKGVFVSVRNREIKINSFDQTMSSVKIYDLKGSLLYDKTSVNKNEFTIDTLNAGNQFMIVMVQLEDGKWISEEIIFHD